MRYCDEPRHFDNRDRKNTSTKILRSILVSRRRRTGITQTLRLQYLLYNPEFHVRKCEWAEDEAIWYNDALNFETLARVKAGGGTTFPIIRSWPLFRFICQSPVTLTLLAVSRRLSLNFQVPVTYRDC